jgi:pimeloyl-[acyl-carrier protein] methyl ester esterase
MQLKPYVQISGSGPNLVLLHGWGLHGGIWQTILPQLQQYFTIYNVDLPGFGQSKLSDDDLEYDYDIDYLVESIDQILPEKCYLMGWSLGGVVAMALAKHCSDKIDKLITVASSPCFVVKDNWPYAMNKEVLESFIGLLSDDFKATLNRFLMIQTMGSATQKQDVAQLKKTVFTHGLPAEKALSGGLQILHDVDLLDSLTELNMPLLRIYGKLDTLVPVRCAELVTDYIPQSQAVIFKKSGHAPFLSESEAFVQQVYRFLAT